MMTTAYLKEAVISGDPLEREFAIMEVCYHLDTYMPWLAARTFKGLVVKQIQDQWLVVLKGEYKGKQQVAFIATDELEELYWALAYALTWDLIAWKADKFMTMRIDQN